MTARETDLKFMFREFIETRRSFAKCKGANDAALSSLARSTWSARKCLCDLRPETSENVLLLVSAAALALKDDYAKSASSSGNSICFAHRAVNSSRQRARRVTSIWLLRRDDQPNA